MTKLRSRILTDCVLINFLPVIRGYSARGAVLPARWLAGSWVRLSLVAFAP